MDINRIFQIIMRGNYCFSWLLLISLVVLTCCQTENTKGLQSVKNDNLDCQGVIIKSSSNAKVLGFYKELKLLSEQLFNDLLDKSVEGVYFDDSTNSFLNHPYSLFYGYMNEYDCSTHKVVMSSFYTKHQDTLIRYDLYGGKGLGEIELKLSINLGITYERGELKFVHPLYLNAERVKKKKVGAITFYYKDSLSLDEARRSEKFNLRMASLFNMQVIHFNYFMNNTMIEAAYFNGFNYVNFMYNMDNYGGFSDILNNNIMAGNGSAYFPHEIVHLYSSKLDGYVNPGRWFSEGIATLYGGAMGLDYLSQLCILKEYIVNKKIEREDFVITDLPFLFGRKSRTSYVGGAILCEMAIQKGGISKYQEFLEFERTEEGLYDAILQVLGKDKEAINRDIYDYVLNLEC